MKERMRRFMFGRYGSDGLSRFINIAALVLYLLSLVLSFAPLGFLAVLLMVWVIYRTFSRNGPRRQAECQAYYKQQQKVVRFFSRKISRIKQHRLYRFYKCPGCAQELRVPRGKGTLSIRCPKCSNAFVKKT